MYERALPHFAVVAHNGVKDVNGEFLMGQARLTVKRRFSVRGDGGGISMAMLRSIS